MSLINYLAKTATPKTPEVGMGVTAIGYTDRYPYSVVAIVHAKKLIVQEDKATRTDSRGMSDSQEYSYEPNPNAPRETITLRKNGRWIRQGESMRSGQVFLVGLREKYHDYSF